jgi:hypothetical protein
MFDFRYHALSLAAVFIALALGLLLGVAIGDSGLVSSAEHDIRASLRGEIRDANRRAAHLQDRLDEADTFEREVYPLLVGGQLQGERIGLVFLGGGSEQTADDVRNGLDESGARLTSVATIGEPLDLDALAGVADGTRYTGLKPDGSPDLDLVESFGFRMAAQYVAPGRLIGRARDALFSAFNGELAPLEGVVLVRDQPGDLDDTENDVADAFEKGFAAGLKETHVPVAGVERTDTEPSQIGWFHDRGLSSVDDIDRTAGHAALVFTLTGASGTFGIKQTADALLPDVAGGASRP